MGTKKLNGFTIIEVLIVLAIAGIILIVVLIAAPQLRVSQRDGERERFADAIIPQYLENFRNSQTHPSSATERQDFVNFYIMNQDDPSTGVPYQIDFRDSSAAYTDVPPVGHIYLANGRWCNRGPGSDGSDNPIAGDDTTLSRFAVLIGVEKGDYYCTDIY